jgi:hypothetical protein
LGAIKPKGLNKIAKKSAKVTYAQGRRTLVLITLFRNCKMEIKYLSNSLNIVFSALKIF